MKKLFNLGMKLGMLALFAFVAVFAVFSTTEAAAGTVAMASGFTASSGAKLNEYAEKELIKHFRHAGTWMMRIPSKNAWVNNDVIKLNQIGADPAVLINNNTYPIATSSRTDSNVAIALYKYETENTKITDDELYALPYDKVGSVQEQHRETLEERTLEHGLHSLAVYEDTAETPVLETTGADDGTGRLKMKKLNILTLKNKLDKLKVPLSGRILVLNADHLKDLLEEDLAFAQRYENHKEGSIGKQYGFEIYESVYSPTYDTTNLQKKAFDAAPAAGDRNASVAIYTKNAAKARGTVKRYKREAADDPENRETVVGFRLYGIVIPIKWTGFGAIVDGKAV
jgi:hypothetical protein